MSSDIIKVGNVHNICCTSGFIVPCSNSTPSVLSYLFSVYYTFPSPGMKHLFNYTIVQFTNLDLSR